MLLIHLPIGGYLHHFYLLSLVNSTAINIRVHLFSILWGIYLGVELLSCIVIVYSHRKHRLHPFQFPQVVFKVSNFSALLSTFVIFVLIFFIN